ncbi:MAG: ATP phosphoribosyltransferase [bacterium]|nr:ATP phosphoribosyltransferase [bacterium]
MNTSPPFNAGELIIALAKGKLLAPALRWLQAAGYVFSDDELRSRKLMLTAAAGGMRAILVKADDVPIYVEYGIADLGIVGKDTLQESAAEVFEPLDLGFGRCKIAVAGWPAPTEKKLHLRSVVRVGTKYPQIARAYFDRIGVQAEIIALQGSVELSVLTGLADVIVDIVETGATLRENGLIVYQEILTSSARLIVNKASHKLKLAAIDRLLHMVNPS